MISFKIKKWNFLLPGTNTFGDAIKAMRYDPYQVILFFKFFNYFFRNRYYGNGIVSASFNVGIIMLIMTNIL